MLQVDPRMNSAPQPITSVDEFESKYSVNVDQGIINIVDRATHLVLATLATPPQEKQYKSFHPSHFYEGNYYFVLSSQCYTAKYVYMFNLQIKSIQCVFGRSHDPHFFESRFIEFGAGFNIPGSQRNDHKFRSGQGVIKVYDLTHQPFKLVKHINVEDGGGFGWDGKVDKEKREIAACDQSKEITLRFSIFDEV